MNETKDKLIIALDVDSSDRALELFHELRDLAGMFKIGSQLFTAAGPEIVRRIIAEGGRVFLDLKFHDIPNTVAAAAVAATRLGVSIFNVHASGGSEMMKRTAASVTDVADRERLTKPKVIAVTVLTSLSAPALKEIGFSGEPGSVVSRLSQAAAASGLDGVVASPQEIELVRNVIPQADFLVVTPGIRVESVSDDDQRRVMTPAGAICAGANYLVVGRPILAASDRRAATEKIVGEIAHARTSQLQTA